MNADQNALFENGGILIFKNAPAGMEFGIDNMLWTIGPQFMGMKMIPPGLHFITYSTSPMNKHSFLMIFAPQQVFIVQWNKQTEELDFGGALDDKEEQERIRLNKCNIDRMLGAYPMETREKYMEWRSLSNYITKDLLQSILPGGVHRFSSMSSCVDSELMEISQESASAFESTLNFTNINLKKSYPPGAHGHLLTKYSQDKTWLLSHLIQQKYHGDWKMLLGELQLSFIVLLYGQNFEGFEQWKKLMICICFARELLETGAESVFFKAFFELLLGQLKQVPTDFFLDVISHESFFADCLKHITSTIFNFYRNESVASGSTELKACITKLDKYLEKHFHWYLIDAAKQYEARLDAEEDDDSPVIVI